MRVSLALVVAVSLVACKREPLREVPVPPTSATRVENTPPQSTEPPPLRARRERMPTVMRAVRCGDESLVIDAPGEWREESPQSAAVKLRLNALQGDRGPWVIARCQPARRTGLPELSALYGRFSQANGAPLPEQSSGYAGIRQIAGMRAITVRAHGTLVQPVDDVPIAAPAQGMAMRAAWIEGRAATFAFELIGDSSGVDAVSIAFESLVSGARPEDRAMAMAE